MITKTELLNRNVVQIDNEYLDLYINLINSNINTKKQKYKTQVHHIIPKYYFIANNLQLDNSKSNKVNLLYRDHLLAHYYLFNCTTGLSKQSNSAVIYLALAKKEYSRYINKNCFCDILNDLQEAYEFQLTTQNDPNSYFSKKRLEGLRKPETIMKMSNSQKKLYNSGKSNSCIYPGHKGSTTNLKHYNNGKINIYLSEDKDIPSGFNKGFLLSDEARLKMGWSKGMTGDRFNTVGGLIVINNGKINKFVEPSELNNYLNTKEWFEGKLACDTGLWYTNGIINTKIPKDKEVPEGYYRGYTGNYKGVECSCTIDGIEYFFKSKKLLFEFLYNLCDHHKWCDPSKLGQYISRKLKRNIDIYLDINNKATLVIFNNWAWGSNYKEDKL